MNKLLVTVAAAAILAGVPAAHAQTPAPPAPQPAAPTARINLTLEQRHIIKELIKDLKVKGSSETLKRGTLVKNIRLTGDPDEIECNTKQVKGLVLKTAFLKKV